MPASLDALGLGAIGYGLLLYAREAHTIGEALQRHRTQMQS
jgi:hypothetical protein